MGNCAPKPKHRSAAAAAVAVPNSGASAVTIFGCETCPIAQRIRISLLLKSVPVELAIVPNASFPIIRCGSDAVSGSADSLLRYVDSRFGGPAAVVEWGPDAAAAAVAMQHRCMERHMEGMRRWARGLGKAEGREKGRKLGDWYGRLVDLMLEHAQMEERLLFPAFERAVDSEVCRLATAEHGRDLPIMNGIKEDMKSLVAMEAGTPFYHEALLNLSLRFKTLQEHCKDHFEEEEKQLLPLLEAAEMSRRERGEEPWSPIKWTEQIIGLMESTHSHLFPFLIAGLLPEEALRYIDLVYRCTSGDPQRLARMLQSLADWIEGRMPLSWIRSTLKSR